MCTVGAKATSSCGTTAPPCIAAGRGPRTRRGSWCARRFRRPRWTGSRACARHRERPRNRRLSSDRSGTFVAAREAAGKRDAISGSGTYSIKPDAREVTLIEMEVLEAIARGDPPAPGEKVELAPADHRRNLTTRGVPLSHLVGKRFKVGEAVLIGGRLNFPCRYLEKLLGRPVYTPLLNRSGLNCRIEVGGIIRKGDPITPLAD